MARLLFRDSQGREGTVELSPTETVYVGRGLECAIRTDDGMVSRKHSQIRMEGGRFVVEDLGSANGTHLNNVRVQKQALGHTDIIQCGSLVIRFLDEGAVNVVQQQMPQAGAAPLPKKGGTMVLERPEAPPLAGGYGQQSPGGFGAQPSPGGFGSQSSPGYGQFPPSQSGMPYGGPPGIPAGGSPYGAPPQMPAPGSVPPINNPTPGFGAARGG